MSLVVRPAVAADAAGIARVHIAAWRETYTRLLPPGALDDLDPVARTQRWTEIIGDDRTEKWVAILDAAIVGWASAGAGQALLDAATGDRPAYLWVAADNPRAHAFYRRNDFVDDGSRSEHLLAGHPVTIARFVR